MSLFQFFSLYFKKISAQNTLVANATNFKKGVNENDKQQKECSS